MSKKLRARIDRAVGSEVPVPARAPSRPSPAVQGLSASVTRGRRAVRNVMNAAVPCAVVGCALIAIREYGPPGLVNHAIGDAALFAVACASVLIGWWVLAR